MNCFIKESCHKIWSVCRQLRVKTRLLRQKDIQRINAVRKLWKLFHSCSAICHSKWANNMRNSYFIDGAQLSENRSWYQMERNMEMVRWLQYKTSWSFSASIRNDFTAISWASSTKQSEVNGFFSFRRIFRLIINFR